LADPRVHERSPRCPRALETKGRRTPHRISPRPCRLGEPPWKAQFPRARSGSRASPRPAFRVRTGSAHPPVSSGRRSGGIGGSGTRSRSTARAHPGRRCRRADVVDHIRGPREGPLRENSCGRPRSGRVSRQATAVSRLRRSRPGPFRPCVERPTPPSDGVHPGAVRGTSLLVPGGSLLSWGRPTSRSCSGTSAGDGGRRDPESLERFQDRLAAATACHAASK